MKFPKSLGEAADLLYDLQQKRLEKSREVKELEERETALEDHILNNMLPASKLGGAKGKFGQVSIKEQVYAEVEDWDKFYSYIAKKKSWELLQKRPGITSLREIWDSGKSVPGVLRKTKDKLHVTKVGTK